MQAEAAAAKAKLREMELARMSAIQVALGLNLFLTFTLQSEAVHQQDPEKIGSPGASASSAVKILPPTTPKPKQAPASAAPKTKKK